MSLIPQTTFKIQKIKYHAMAQRYICTLKLLLEIIDSDSGLI